MSLEPQIELHLEDVDCPNCGASDAAALFEIEDYLYGLRGRFTVCRCSLCGLIYLSPRPTRGTIAHYYPPQYAPFRTAIQDEVSAIMRWMRRRKSVQRRQAVERHVPQRDGRILDVGCSTGIFLDEMRSSGWRTTGVELMREAAEYAHDRFGLDVVEGDLLEVGFAPASFDAITMFDVLEHTFEPAAVLDRAHSLLRPGGVLSLTLPNWESLDHRLFGKYWVGFDAPRHLSVFPNEVLGNMLHKSGFDVVENRCRFGGYFTFITSLRTWLRADPVAMGQVAKAVEPVVDFPGMRLPFQPLFTALEWLGVGGIRFVVARKS